MKTSIIIASLFLAALVLGWSGRGAPCACCSDVIAVFADHNSQHAITPGGCR